MLQSSSEIFFHAGLQKTGSTFLQNNVFPYIENGTYIRASQRLVRVIEGFARNPGPFLVSNENLATRGMLLDRGVPRSGTLEALASAFPGSNCILFLREPASHLISCYAQFVMYGGLKSFSEYAAEREHFVAHNSLIDQVLEMKFARVLLFDYESLAGAPEDTIEAIGQFMGGVRFTPPRRSSRRMHASPKRAGLRFVRLINHIVWGKNHPKRLARWQGTASSIRRALNFARVDQVRLAQGPLHWLNSLGPEVVSADEYESLRLKNLDHWEAARERIRETQLEHLGYVVS